jgi:hypothetical protein
MPAADEMQSIFRYFKAHGFDGSGTQMEAFNLWNNLLNFYCFGRMAYDTDLSLTEAIGQLSKLFGAGAEEVAELELEVGVMPDEYGNGIDESLVAEGDTQTASKWMTQFDPDMVQVTSA